MSEEVKKTKHVRAGLGFDKVACNGMQQIKEERKVNKRRGACEKKK
jgi:hypothetical protein